MGFQVSVFPSSPFGLRRAGRCQVWGGKAYACDLIRFFSYSCSSSSSRNGSFLDKNVQYTFEDENEYDDEDEKKNDEDRVPLK